MYSNFNTFINNLVAPLCLIRYILYNSMAFRFTHVFSRWYHICTTRSLTSSRRHRRGYWTVLTIQTKIIFYVLYIVYYLFIFFYQRTTIYNRPQKDGPMVFGRRRHYPQYTDVVNSRQSHTCPMCLPAVVITCLWTTVKSIKYVKNIYIIMYI